MMVGLSMITSSRLLTMVLVWRNKPPTTGKLPTTGRPVRSSRSSVFIRPPMATIWPSLTRTIESVSLTALDASGRRKTPCAPRSMSLFFSVTRLMVGCTCSITLPASSICGVTSSEMPEKKGCSVSVGVVTVLAPLLVVLLEMPVT